MVNELGRPRDTRIDAAVLGATADLLAEVGYAELTVAAIADRAGTSRPAIYRRWPTKAHLVHEAAFRGPAAMGIPGTGSIAGDIREVVRRTTELLTTPLARLAVPGLISEAASDPVLHQRLLDRFASDGWQGLDTYLNAAVARGDLDPAVSALSVLEIVIGAVVAAMLVRGPDCLDDAWVDATARIVMRGIGT